MTKISKVIFKKTDDKIGSDIANKIFSYSSDVIGSKIDDYDVDTILLENKYSDIISDGYDIYKECSVGDGNVVIAKYDDKYRLYYYDQNGVNLGFVKLDLDAEISSIDYDKYHNSLIVTTRGGAVNTYLISDMKKGIDNTLEIGENASLSSYPSNIVTVDSIERCETRKDYLDLVMPWYQYYCKLYGIKYPGVLALQGIYETGVPDKIAPSLRNDNNMGGLKYYSGTGIPNVVGPGTLSPSNEGSTPYCKFNNVSDYMEAQVWNIAKGDVFKAALASSNMEDFAVNEIDVWIGHDYGNYKWDVINDYYNYDLSKYE